MKTQSFGRVVMLAMFAALSACRAGSGDFNGADNSGAPNSSAKAASLEATDTIQPGDGGEKGLNVRLLNYTDDNIGRVYVNDDWAGDMGKHLGGTSTAGGAGVPVKWRKDFKLRISWQTDSMYDKDPKSQASRMVPIEPYKESDGDSLWVAFLPGDVIKLYVSGYFPGNPRFPAKMEMPFIQCWKDGFKDCPEAGRPDR